MQSTAVVALALLESVQAFQAPVMRSRLVQMFSEGDLGESSEPSSRPSALLCASIPQLITILISARASCLWST